MATLEEKKAFYATRGVTKESMTVAMGDGSESRSMTDEEFDNYMSMCSEPEDLIAREDYHSDPTNWEWKANRIQQYPKLDPQLDGIFHALKAIRAQGIDLGEAGNAYVDGIQTVKDENPKPV